uniref:Uncharacterized protein n=1 Tax=Knipowitschia caucasica TaxID=637954 RepID=A0AAV2IXT1_KNICA
MVEASDSRSAVILLFFQKPFSSGKAISKRQSKVQSWWSLLLPLLTIVFCVMILEFYAEAMCSAKMEAPRVARCGSAALFVSALVLAHFWDRLRPLGTTPPAQSTEHVLSGGVIVSATFFILDVGEGGGGAEADGQGPQMLVRVVEVQKRTVRVLRCW